MRQLFINGTFAALAAAVLAFTACTQENEGNREPTRTETTNLKAVAKLQPTANNTVEGIVTFTSTAGGVYVVADLSGLTPGAHGFHIHERGDCSAPDASSAGGHFNPTGMNHGAPDSADRHTGDLGNVTADNAGNAHLERTDTQLALSGDSSIIGKAVIVHADPDDFTTQPTGNAGARVACGVIQAAGE